jgi:hypothetical protein
MASARQIRDEIMKMTIVVNSDPAQKEIYELNQKTKELVETNKGLSSSIKEVEVARKKEEIAINNYADKIDKLKKKISDEKAEAITQIKTLMAQQKQHEVGSTSYVNYQNRIDAARAKSITSTKNLEGSISMLVAKQSKLVESYDKNSAAAKKYTSDLNANKNAINENKVKVTELTSSLDINQMTMQQLRKEAALLKVQLSQMIPGSQQSIQLQTQLDKINNRMTDVNGGAKKTSSSFRELADRFNHYSGIVTVMAGVLVGFGISVQNIIERNNKLVDAQTAVAKTVNMTKEEVEDLTKAFSEFDTRTSKIDLLKIAETGGRLGVGKAEITDFVKEVDKANVALGDGFAGGVEEVTNTLGKLKGLYSETKDLDISVALNQIGSAMNELGAAGAASEANIGQFALRLGSLPENLKPTIAQALALGAAFEESGIDAERASTAYASVIRTAAKDGDKFAKVMNLSTKEVESLMNKDPLEFFLKFSEGAKGLDTTDLAKMLDYLKLNDQYVISTMGAASENTDRFRKSIDLSNKSLSEATSLQKEFEKVNNNTAAVFEKVQKRLAGMFANESVAKGLNFIIEGFGKMIGAIETTNPLIIFFSASIVFFAKLMSIAAVAVLSYNTAVMLSNITMVSAKEKLLAYTVIQKVNNFLNQTSAVLQNLVTAAYLRGQIALAALTGNTIRQAAAQKMLNSLNVVGPWGVLVTVILAVSAAYLLFSKRLDEAAEKKKILDDITKSAAQSSASEISQLDQLYKAATNAAKGKDAQRLAAEKMIELYPEQFKNVSAEIIMNGKAESSYLSLRDSIIAAARAKAAQLKLEERAAERLERDEKLNNDIEAQKAIIRNPKKRSTTGNISGANELSGGGTREISADDVAAAAKYTLGVLNNMKKAYKIGDDAADQFLLDIKEAADKKSPGKIKDPKSGYTIPDDEGDKAKKDAADKAKREAERLARLKEQHDREMDQISKQGEEAARLSNQIALDITDAKIDAMDEGVEKEIAEINIQELRKTEAIEKQKIGATDIAILQKKIDKAVGDDKKLFQSLMDAWLKNNEELENEKLAASEIFELKRETAQYKDETRRLDKIDKAHQTELGHLKRQQNEELATYQTLADLKEGLRGRMDERERQKITTWAEGKEALNKIYQKRELELQITHLEAMVKLYEGLDLGILTPAQREEVMKFIDEAGNKIAEFKAKVAGAGQEDTKGKKKRGGGDDNGKGGGIDILGLSADSWDNLIEDIKIGAASATEIISAAAGAMQSAFATYFQYVEMNEKRQLAIFTRNTETKKLRLKKQLTDGYINQETYKKRTIEADKELDKKKAELEVKAAKRQRIVKIAEIITATSLAIMQAYAQLGPIAGTIAAVLVGTLGAVQIATVMKTPLPTAEGFEGGYGMEYPIEREQDGKKFNVRRKRLSSGLVDRPTHFIAGENNKVEMVIDSPTWTRYPEELKRAIYSANSRAKGFEGGLNTQAQASPSNDETMIMLISTVRRMNDTLDNIQKYGIEAKIAKTARTGKDFTDVQDMYNKLNDKNKH